MIDQLLTRMTQKTRSTIKLLIQEFIEQEQQFVKTNPSFKCKELYFDRLLLEKLRERNFHVCRPSLVQLRKEMNIPHYFKRAKQYRSKQIEILQAHV